MIILPHVILLLLLYRILDGNHGKELCMWFAAHQQMQKRSSELLQLNRCGWVQCASVCLCPHVVSLFSSVSVGTGTLSTTTGQTAGRMYRVMHVPWSWPFCSWKKNNVYYLKKCMKCQKFMYFNVNYNSIHKNSLQRLERCLKLAFINHYHANQVQFDKHLLLSYYNRQFSDNHSIKKQICRYENFYW